MPIVDAANSLLLVVDFQARLMPAIAGGEAAIGQANRLLAAARLLGIPVAYTEQNPRGLGGTVEALAARDDEPVFAKMTFDAWRSAELRDVAGERDLVVMGCEAHVCVLQTVLGALGSGRRVTVVRDAIGSRREESRTAALERMARHGADLVTTEMVIFEWLGTAEHAAFKPAIALVK
jgi:nicotinamidase-related amidase